MLSPADRSFLHACCWGDGTVSQSGVLLLRHSAKQWDYLEWKAQEAARILGCDFWVAPYQAKCKGKEYPACKWYSAASEEIKDLRAILFAEGVKKITPEFLGPIDRRGLAVLYMDDGSLHLRKRGQARDGSPYIRERIVELALYVTYEEVILIQQWILGLTGALLTPREPMKKLSPGKYNLRGNGTQARRFIQAIEEYQIPSMRYKFDLQYDTRTNRGKAYWSEADLCQYTGADKGTRARDTLAA